MAEDFPKLKMQRDIQVHEEQKITNKINSNSPTPRHIIIKMALKKKKENSKGRGLGSKDLIKRELP